MEIGVPWASHKPQSLTKSSPCWLLFASLSGRGLGRTGRCVLGPPPPPHPLRPPWAAAQALLLMGCSQWSLSAPWAKEPQANFPLEGSVPGKKLATCNQGHFWKMEVELPAGEQQTHRQTPKAAWLERNVPGRNSVLRVTFCFHSDASELSSCLQIRQGHVRIHFWPRPGNLVVSLLPSCPFLLHPFPPDTFTFWVGSRNPVIAGWGDHPLP